MYRILFIETGEYLYSDKFNSHLLYSNEERVGGLRPGFLKTAEFESKIDIEDIFSSRKRTTSILHNKERIILNLSSRLLFDIVEV